jgi:hypothetical protein
MISNTLKRSYQHKVCQVLSNSNLATAKDLKKKHPSSVKIKTSESALPSRLMRNDKALARWESLRSKVVRGFFKPMAAVQKAVAEKLEGIHAVIESVWKLAHASSEGIQLKEDTTSDFSRKAWVQKKTGHVESDTVKLSRAMAIVSFSSAKLPAKREFRSLGGGKKTMGGLDSTAEEEKPTSFLGIAQSRPRQTQQLAPVSTPNQFLFKKNSNISIDRTGSVNIGKQLLVFANWVRKARQDSTEDQKDFEKVQLSLNRCWKLFLLGLSQLEPVSRYIALTAINRVVSVMTQTLLDLETGKVNYVNLANYSHTDGSLCRG